jgi:hypothetical protein
MHKHMHNIAKGFLIIPPPENEHFWAARNDKPGLLEKQR